MTTAEIKTLAEAYLSPYKFSETALGDMVEYYGPTPDMRTFILSRGYLALLARAEELAVEVKRACSAFYSRDTGIGMPAIRVVQMEKALEKFEALRGGKNE